MVRTEAGRQCGSQLSCQAWRLIVIAGNGASKREGRGKKSFSAGQRKARRDGRAFLAQAGYAPGRTGSFRCDWIRRPRCSASSTISQLTRILDEGLWVIRGPTVCDNRCSRSAPHTSTPGIGLGACATRGGLLGRWGVLHDLELARFCPRADTRRPSRRPNWGRSTPCQDVSLLRVPPCRRPTFSRSSVISFFPALPWNARRELGISVDTAIGLHPVPELQNG